MTCVQKSYGGYWKSLNVYVDIIKLTEPKSCMHFSFAMFDQHWRAQCGQKLPHLFQHFRTVAYVEINSCVYQQLSRTR